MLELIDEYDIIPNKKDFNGVKCCACNTDKTSVRNDGRPRWYECRCDKENCTRYICKIDRIITPIIA